MRAFKKITSIAVHLPIANIDTDMIIPKQYLKTIKRTGLGKCLFAELRYDEANQLKADFVLNKPAYRNAGILLTEKILAAVQVVNMLCGRCWILGFK